MIRRQPKCTQSRSSEASGGYKRQVVGVIVEQRGKQGNEETKQRKEEVWCGVVWCGVVWCGVV